jgi:hypothetical protein
MRKMREISRESTHFIKNKRINFTVINNEKTNFPQKIN